MNKNYHLISDSESWSILEYAEFKSALRGIPGIPKNDYEVIDSDNIFVLSKLAQETAKHVTDRFDPQLADIALKLVPTSYLSPIEAIEWGIIPETYEVLKDNDEYVIQHNVFKALIPGVFTSIKEVNEVLAKLLIGAKHQSIGNCMYNMQPMLLEKTPESRLNDLLNKPLINPSTSEHTRYFSANLADVQFTKGFTAISFDIFNQLRSLESEWIMDSNRAAKIVFKELKRLPQLISRLSWHVLNDKELEGLDFDDQDIETFRSYYPELINLSDQLLVDILDEYNQFIENEATRLPSGGASFFFYSLGKMSSINLLGDAALNVGVIAAFALLAGYSEENSMILAQDWYNYNKELSTFTKYVRDVMQFLDDNNNVAKLNLLDP